MAYHSPLACSAGVQVTPSGGVAASRPAASMPDKQQQHTRASMTSWRLLNGTKAEDIDRAVAHRLASFPPKGLVGAFAVQTGPDAVTVGVVDGGAADDALASPAEKLAGRAEPIATQVGRAQDLIALADDGRQALA